MKDFSLDGRDHIDLCDLMKVTDLCDSGAAAKHIIADGNVTVDGAVELRKRAKIRAGQIVEYKGQKIRVL